MNNHHKATKGDVIRNQHTTTIFYHYRGYTYDVEYSNNWSYCTTPADVQHRDAQARIDKLIEAEEKKPKQSDDPFCALDMLYED